MAFPFFTLTFILIIYLAYRRQKATKAEEETIQSFWKREMDANFTRKQDISHLDYITVPLDTFPLGRYSDPSIEEFEAQLKDLCQKKICNLNGMSNTDLKLKYGLANLQVLSDCDTNYSTLVSVLARYGDALYQKEDIEAAKSVLEYGITCKTDVSSNYTLLASIYQQQNHPEKIQELIHFAEALTSIRKPAIIEKLQSMCDFSL